MLGQLAAAQFEIEAAIADLVQGGAPASAVMDSRTQLAAVGALRQQLAGADIRTLAAMRADISAAVAACQSAAQQARAAGDTANADNIANYAQNARAVVSETMRGMKDFEPFLHFANAQDEADYRRRSEERSAYIASQQAKGTPQGDLNASGAAVGEMADAAAHGAGQSPEFQTRFDKLTQSTQLLREQLRRDGKDVSEFDSHLREDLRTILRAKGVPDTKIDALFAAHLDNPLEAAQAFVADQKGGISDKELGDLSREALEYKVGAEEKQSAASVSGPQVSVPTSAMDAMADLKALGVVVAEHDASSPPVHGVTAPIPASPSQAAPFRS